MKTISLIKVPLALITVILMFTGIAFGQGGWTDGGSVVRTTTSGDNVGIGTSTMTSTAKLDVRGDIYSVGSSADFYAYYSPTQYIRMHHNKFHTYFDYMGGHVNWRDNAGSTRFHIQDVTGRIGISTAGPLGMLDIRGTSNTILFRTQTSGGEVFWSGGNNNHIFMGGYSTGDDLQITVENNVKMTISTSGNVGIGTTVPTAKLDVRGNLDVFNGVTKITNTGSGAVLLDLNTDRNWQFKQFGTGDATALELKSIGGSGNKNFLISTTGSVGIGTTSPTTKLAVNGTITTKEVIVTDTGWSDFVFEDGYNLMPIDELQQSIKENGRLPGIPSSEEVAANGVGLGEMQSKFLQKIEELTLYVIELKNENEELKERVTKLEL